MKALPRLIVLLLVVIDIFLIGFILLRNTTFAVLEPAGLIAAQEHRLFLFAILLSLVGVVPVFIFTVYVVLSYRDGKTKRAYSPDWEKETPLQVAWWIFLVLIILTLGIVTVITTHRLDPFKPIESSVKPLTIQVVALQWKWLFIYPEQNIATVNYVVFPEKTPITFELTADAPMNSFWIPQLGGQLYAMEGMVNRTHLQADRPGEYKGSSAEISGEGFAGMKFIAKATTGAEFDSWVASVKNSGELLDLKKYTTLAKPSENTPVTLYAPVQNGLYNEIVMKFMAPSPASQNIGDRSNTHQMEHGMKM